MIQNWMRRIDTIQYLGLWEQLNNPDFNRVEFDTFRSEAGHNYFTNLENLNAYLIERGVSQSERIMELNRTAIRQMKILAEERSRLLDGNGEE